MKKICVFDLDGTLVNSIEDIAGAVNRALKQIGRAPYPVSDYRHMVGNGMELLMQRALKEGTRQELLLLTELYQKEYLSHCCENTKPYSGILKLLNQLKQHGFLLAVLSNKPQVQSEAVVSSLFPAHTFFRIIGQRAEFPRKPAPDSLFALLASAQASKEEAWYIGDSDVDIQLGYNAGVDTIGVSWGFRGKDELKNAGAKQIVDTPLELQKQILE
ncbi:HAD family hydrolase [Ructibacterium gallinarum]|uniref:HAD family hydrolase n=1 Tax=Ructibacterium gallinarum TaxID=2779355 RepID=A0A9D5LX22_9FIRM|nr:HAD family hydrolase [Ructibacterium gallinarum]MBE5039378.1 HAD family hydrolase [Ructibacterium gallinarum]